jgi:hypothetical protein
MDKRPGVFRFWPFDRLRMKALFPLSSLHLKPDRFQGNIMAKEQKRGNRETKKPKTKKNVVVATAAASSVKGLTPQAVLPRKKG